MNLVRTGIILMVIGLTVLLITSIFSPKIYNIMGETLDNFTINLDTYSEFLHSNTYRRQRIPHGFTE
nr:MAG: hypothetical protein TU36_04780 [Vulcanisaeta sp. AZ3]